MKNIIVTTLILLFAGNVLAQSPILTKVKIEFERKENISASRQGRFGRDNSSTETQYSSSFYSYESADDKSVYKAIPKEENSYNRGYFGRNDNDESVIYMDFDKQEIVELKKVFEKSYLITDSLRQIDWKMTNDFREIAGFNCRRATAVIMDSVFVVAFYTDEIIPSGGPEGFSGLPGMILGLVINRLHTTWYATKVNVTDVNVKDIVPPLAPKAEKTTRAKLMAALKDRFKDGGGWFGSGDSMIWSIML